MQMLTDKIAHVSKEMVWACVYFPQWFRFLWHTLQQCIAPWTFTRLFFSSHQHLFVVTAQKSLSRWNTDCNKNGKLTTQRTQRSFEKSRSKGKWAGEKAVHPASSQLFLAHLHVIFFSSDLRKSLYVFWHMPFIITPKMSLSPLYLIQHDGEVPRLATTGAQLRAACLCLSIMCLNYQTLLRAKRCLGRAAQPMVPLHSTTLTQADVQAFPELAYILENPSRLCTHARRNTLFYEQALVTVGKEVFASQILKATLGLLNPI